MTCKGTLRQVLIYLRPPPLLGFCLGWSIKFVGSDSGQIQSVKLLQNMVHTPHREGGGGGELNRREGLSGGATVHKAGSKDLANHYYLKIPSFLNCTTQHFFL
jgi:hypothetical protein